ncbi:carbohydrate ABC transporter permease [Vampirovibrio chlorellavorus]|uniref:carbohydrate ABC transporter permease n=1 Tax=Vampirovibrio chlorellavorus TaxID=758823 RepID=UPI0026ECBE77|nr:carbohydrate ABC transporter permease [Vampirovibrio chlorellavorus]
MKSITLKQSLQYLLLSLLVLLSVFPFLWLLSTALKSPAENVFAYPPQFIPTQPTLQNFISVWQKVPMPWFFINSIVVTVLTIVFNISLSVMAAYPLARMRFKGQNAIFFSILATMMIPFQVLMIPLYLICLKLNLTDAAGWVNGWLGLVLPFAVSGFGIFFVRQALVTLPKELEESAVLDGCNSLQILWHVLLPLIRPTLATLAVFAFMATWGEFLWPSIILSEPSHFTLPVGLVQLQSTFSADWKLIAAGTLLSMVPMLVFFFALQKYFVSGATSGAVKG